ncbi:MAG: hypothetical protein QM796_04660 [Chthoniobacteraceae bacterium]
MPLQPSIFALLFSAVLPCFSAWAAADFSTTDLQIQAWVNKALLPRRGADRL